MGIVSPRDPLMNIRQMEHVPQYKLVEEGDISGICSYHSYCVRGIKLRIMSTWGNSIDLRCTGTKLCITQDLSLLEGKHKTTSIMSQAAAVPEWAVSRLCSNTDQGAAAWLHPHELCDLKS